jgi:predicted transcriptional regulator
VKLRQGKVLLVKLPRTKEDRSKAVDLAKVKRLYQAFKLERVGVIGVVGRILLNKIRHKTDFEFGISQATAVAASRGFNVFVLVAGRMANHVIEKIDIESVKHVTDIVYEVKDGQMLQQVGSYTECLSKRIT